ncbi:MULTISPECIES: dTDP-4-dehydrorhamnose reductase [Methylomonas]|uniref:dTDP-4-dehydrorhamnose reductase n=2 Tax=Methylomonas TaxID=416 RepID=A0A140E3Z4_9GAMM|nr:MULTISPECIES: dTDP-4-dehydrorhamnose reductase [Methylomonas]AMK75118.1 dTDP-4-dehydrorhamnose reductase [Methylomonas denitrificans]OAI02608.1 NAD(P)-dependent oxidoreductase [Methylomonas methanica]TCV83066.1 dTDP-4-dehydrorhamnose reductase [Methylomonas methanica]
MKILLFGKNGQLGWELQRSLAPLGDLVALDRFEQQYCGDLSNPNGIAGTVRALRPDVIVNAAAYTAVDKAESESELANIINAVAPGALAEEAKRCGAWLVHYSTDYVFDGSGDKPWREDDQVDPLSVYGQTKLAGEQAIQASDCRHLIFRTSWVYAARGNNFAKTMLRLAQERQQLSVINDQIGTPTGAELLADVSAHAIRQALKTSEVAGVYHLTAGGETSWYDYAHLVFDYARRAGLELKTDKQSVAAIPTSAYQTPARRPLNSRLNTEKLQTVFGLQLPAWQLGVERMLSELYGK